MLGHLIGLMGTVLFGASVYIYLYNYLPHVRYIFYTKYVHIQIRILSNGKASWSGKYVCIYRRRANVDDDVPSRNYLSFSSDIFSVSPG